ncbi:unnamed protein product [Cercopithifilaria johnstoni]|uniref:Sushi domain-containing protein n=1 Tax=Cercopithifilaria johnstoni TaxID=2874296 RepID=A0A8J2MRP8_9BILA|nr:unnamed protein product [Cercopithifilaria johnstoni]
MLIRVKQFNVLVLALSAVTTGVFSLPCEDIIGTDSGDVVYTEANQAIKHAPGTTALMLCKFGYTSSFPFIVSCQENGKWSNKLGECILISKTCDAQISQHNIIYMPPGISNRYPSGTFAILQCSLGQIPTGHSSAMCLDGRWTAELGVCKKLLDNRISNNVNRTSNIKVTEPKVESGSTIQSEITPDNIVENAVEKSLVTNMLPANAENITLTNVGNTASANAESTTSTIAESAISTIAESATSTIAESATSTITESATSTIAESATSTIAESATSTSLENTTSTNEESATSISVENTTSTSAENTTLTSVGNTTSSDSDELKIDSNMTLENTFFLLDLLKIKS